MRKRNLVFVMCLSLMCALGDPAAAMAAESVSWETEICETAVTAEEISAEESMVPEETTEEIPTVTEEEPEEEIPEETEAETETSEETEELDAAAALLQSGTFCSTVYWELDEDGTLTLSGSGEAGTFLNAEEYPWYPLRGQIRTLVVEEGITGIGTYAFSGCGRLTHASIAGSVKEMYYGVWENCTGLKSAGAAGSGCDLEFGWTTEIPNGAFYGCSGLEKVTIPEGIVTIGTDAFTGCTGLKKLILPSTLSMMKTRCLGEGSLMDSRYLKSAGPAGSGCDIEFGFTDKIPASFFSDCSQLKSVQIPDTIREIGDWAFARCVNLESLTLPESVTILGLRVFSDCDRLVSAGPVGSGCDLTFGWKTEIPANAFYGMTHLQKVTLPETTTVIGDRAFGDLSSLTELVIPAGVTYIGEGVWDYSDPKRLIFKTKNCEFHKDAFDWITTDRVFYGYEGSTAQKKAEAEGFTFKCFRSTPVLTGVTNVDGGVRVDWKANGCENYRVYYKTAGGSWKKAGDTAKNSFTVTGLTMGTEYSFTVRCYDPEGSYFLSGYDKTGLACTYVSCVKAKLSNTGSGIKASWDAVKGAEGYYVYRMNGTSGSYTRIAVLKGSSSVTYTDETAKNGSTYTYAVRAYKGSLKGSYTKVTGIRLTAVTLTGLTNSTAGKLKITWTQNTKADGYLVRISTDSSFASGNTDVTVNGGTTAAKTVSSLKKGKTYYVRIRAYKTDSSGKKYYSPWSGRKYLKLTR